MKYSPALVFILSLLGAVYVQAEEVLPPQFNFDRYSKMAARSPEGDLVTLASTSDHNFKKYLTTREPVDGYSIANIEWSDKVGATKVTISKDENFATLTFNQALLSQSAPNAGGASRSFAPPMPALPGSNPASVPNPVSSKLPNGIPAEVQQLIPSREATRPHARRLLQRSPSGPSKMPSQAGAAAKN